MIIAAESSPLELFYKACQQLTNMDSCRVMSLLQFAISKENNSPNLVRVSNRVVAVGDIHGDFYPLSEIFNTKTQSFVFLGDFVDRRMYGTEVLITLLLLKYAYGVDITLLRGNHECQLMSQFFQAECVSKYGNSVTRLFIKLFCYLPIAARNDNFLFLHGGLAKGLETFDDFEKYERRFPIVDPRKSPIFDSIWSDTHAACENPASFGQNERGGGTTRGPIVAANRIWSFSEFGMER